MRTFTMLLIASTMLWGCNIKQNDTMILLSQADSIMELKPDSALMILQSVKDTTGLDENSRAYYLLLLTQAEYKCDTVQTVDTLLDYSIAHYRKVDDESLLARSLYYRGMTQFYRGKPDVALTYLMEGVDIAEKIGDMLQLSKYYESLFQVNYSAKYYEKSLEFARMFLDNSIARKDTNCIVRGYSHISSNSKRVGKQDSVLVYLQHSLSLLPYTSISTQTATLTNIGVRYYEIQNYDSAKNYLQKSLAIKPRYNTNKVLGDIYYKEGDIKLASEYWEKALDTDNIRLKISTLKSIYKQVLETNDYEQAHTLLIKINTLNDSVEKSLKTKEIAELQYKYDASKKEKEYYHEKSRLYLLLLILLLIVFTSVIIIFFYRRRIKMYLEEIKQHTKKAEDLDRRIARKEQQIKANERSIRELEKEKGKLIKEKEKIVLKHNDNLRIGNCIYDSIRNGEPIPTNNPKSETCLVEYFKTVHPEKVTAWDEQYEQLTKRQTVYLILKDLQYDDNKIKEILSCSDNALRVMKSRIKLIQQV